MTKRKKLFMLLIFIGGMAILLTNKGRDILDPISLFGLLLVIVSAVSLRIHVNPPYYPRDLEKRIDAIEREMQQRKP